MNDCFGQRKLWVVVEEHPWWERVHERNLRRVTRIVVAACDTAKQAQKTMKRFQQRPPSLFYSYQIIELG